MLLRKDLKELCRLFELEITSIDRENIIESIKDKIEIEILKNVLDNLVYIDTGEIRTKEDYTMINSKTKDQYECIKSFNLNKLYKGINDMSLEEYNAKKSIIDMIIPKIFIMYAEIYTPQRYNNMLDRLYNKATN